MILRAGQIQGISLNIGLVPYLGGLGIRRLVFPKVVQDIESHTIRVRVN